MQRVRRRIIGERQQKNRANAGVWCFLHGFVHHHRQRADALAEFMTETGRARQHRVQRSVYLIQPAEGVEWLVDRFGCGVILGRGHTAHIQPQLQQLIALLVVENHIAFAQNQPVALGVDVPRQRNAHHQVSWFQLFHNMQVPR